SNYSFEFNRQGGSVVALIVVNWRLVLESGLQQLKRLRIAAATSVLADSEGVLHFMVCFDCVGIVASTELHLKLLCDIRELHHKFRSIGVVRIEPVGDPDRTDVELRKIVVTGGKA